jgi:hypothetical protein
MKDSSLLRQVSGFRVTFDLSRPELSRLVLAEVSCPDCPMQWTPLKVGFGFSWAFFLFYCHAEKYVLHVIL